MIKKTQEICLVSAIHINLYVKGQKIYKHAFENKNNFSFLSQAERHFGPFLLVFVKQKLRFQPDDETVFCSLLFLKQFFHYVYNPDIHKLVQSFLFLIVQEFRIDSRCGLL